MAYTGNPSTSNTDAVRLLVHDTSTSTGSTLLSDTEYQWFIDQNTNLYFAASAAAKTIGAKYSDDIITKRVGDLSWTKGSPSGGITALYSQLAAELRAEGVRKGVAPYAGGISVADKAANEADPDWDRVFHTTGDNPSLWSSTG